jgi:hypothetical protein
MIRVVLFFRDFFVMSLTTSCRLDPQPLPDDIVKGASRLGLDVSWTSGTEFASRFYRLKFTRGDGKVVFAEESFFFDALFAHGRQFVQVYGTFVVVLGLRLAKSFLGRGVFRRVLRAFGS